MKKILAIGFIITMLFSSIVYADEINTKEVINNDEKSEILFLGSTDDNEIRKDAIETAQTILPTLMKLESKNKIDDSSKYSIGRSIVLLEDSDQKLITSNVVYVPIINDNTILGAISYVKQADNTFIKSYSSVLSNGLNGVLENGFNGNYFLVKLEEDIYCIDDIGN